MTPLHTKTRLLVSNFAYLFGERLVNDYISMVNILLKV